MSEEKQPLSPTPEESDRRGGYHPPEADPPAQQPEPEKKPEHSHKHRQKSVFQYITILFAAAFVLLLYTFMMERRQNDILQQQSNDKLNQLQQQSISAVQSLDNLYQENEYLKQSMDHLETQISNLEQEKQQLEQVGHYFGVIFLFAVGAGVGGNLSIHYGVPVIWGSCILLLISFCLMFAEQIE